MANTDHMQPFSPTTHIPPHNCSHRLQITAAKSILYGYDLWLWATTGVEVVICARKVYSVVGAGRRGVVSEL